MALACDFCGEKTRLSKNNFVLGPDYAAICEPCIQIALKAVEDKKTLEKQNDRP